MEISFLEKLANNLDQYISRVISSIWIIEATVLVAWRKFELEIILAVSYDDRHGGEKMNHYSLEQPFVDELVEDVRIGLLQEFDRLDHIDANTSAWTNSVKSTLTERCRDHFMNGDFFAFSSNTFGEYLLDFSYGSYPPAFNKIMPVKKGVSYRLFVACESEWGVEDNLARTYTAVLDDFCKLLDVRAQVKVLVFGYNEEGLEGLHSAFESLLDSRRAELAGETWFFLGVPWDSERRVSGKLVFSAPAPEAVRLDFVEEEVP